VSISGSQTAEPGNSHAKYRPKIGLAVKNATLNLSTFETVNGYENSFFHLISV